MKKFSLLSIVVSVFISLGCTSSLRSSAMVLEGTNAKVSVEENQFPIAELSGTEEQMGDQAGQLLKEPMQHLIALMELSPQFKMDAADLAKMKKHISADYLAELEATANAAQIAPEKIISANVAMDTLCTVLVTDANGIGPVRVARNMDFFPAEFLGPATILTIRKPQNKHAFASVNWPGYSGVASGMNDVGVVVCILQNLGSDKIVRDGTPIAFRAREVLEKSDNLNEAVKTFCASPLASSHFLMMADTKNACVVWQDNEKVFHKKDAQNGWLSWSNGNPDANNKQDDARACALVGVCAVPPQEKVSDEWLKEKIIDVRLRWLNAQVMLFNPETLSLDVACASFWRSAGKRPWTKVELGEYFQK